MQLRKRTARVALSTVAFALLLAGCGEKQFTEPVSFAGTEVSSAVLNLGQSTYMAYCRACHGVNGDGNGPAAKGLRPPPRDFRDGIYKFAAVESGYLPNDDDFRRIIRHGLDGTAMLPWDISDERLDAVIQYIKTFSDRWQDEYEEKGEPIVAPQDPFGAAQRDQAVEQGKKLYHALAQCMSCHPAYATYAEIYSFGEEMMGTGRSDLDQRIYTPELKDSDYSVKILPPDFTFHTMRSVRDGSERADLYRVIASGIGGTAMPTWQGSLPEENIWAMAYYVEWLIELKDTADARALREALMSRDEFTPPKEG